MQAVILGGCADMAVPLVSLLKSDVEVSRVILADMDGDKAQRTAEKHGAKFEAVAWNADDTRGTIALLRGKRVAFGYVGPFYRFERKLAQCAVEAGTDYVSIADDYDAYLDVINLDGAAAAADVKVLTGFGNSPGLTQVCARKGYNEVPNPERISVNWCAGSNESVGASNLMHLFHIFNGTTLQWMDGREVRVKTGAGKKRVEFPAPIGWNYVYYTGHAESVSLPRNLPGLREVTLHGGVKPNYIVGLLKVMSALGLFATHARRARLARFFHHIEGWFSSPGMDKSVGRIEVYGKENGRPVCMTFTYSGHIAEITSMPAYLAARWLWQGRFDGKPGGVYAAERLLEDPSEFLAALKQLGVGIWES